MEEKETSQPTVGDTNKFETEEKCNDKKNQKFNIAIDSKRSAVQKYHCILPTSGVVHE